MKSLDELLDEIRKNAQGTGFSNDVQNAIEADKAKMPNTVRGFFEKWLYDHAIFPETASKIMDYVIPKVNEDMERLKISHKVSWNEHEESYPKPLYGALMMYVRPHVYQWANDNMPMAFWKPAFAHTESNFQTNISHSTQFQPPMVNEFDELTNGNPEEQLRETIAADLNEQAAELRENADELRASADALDAQAAANEAVADDLTEELGDDEQPELPEDVMPAEEEAEPEEGEPVAVAEEEVPKILSTDEVLEEGDDD